MVEIESLSVASCSHKARQMVDLPLAVGAQKQYKIASRMLLLSTCPIAGLEKLANVVARLLDVRHLLSELLHN